MAHGVGSVEGSVYILEHSWCYRKCWSYKHFMVFRESRKLCLEVQDPFYGVGYANPTSMWGSWAPTKFNYCPYISWTLSTCDPSDGQTLELWTLWTQ